MTYPTKDQLEEWRQQGMTNAEIAKKTGRSIGTINGLFSRYKISQRTRSIPEDKIDAICQMKQAGSSAREIAEKTGCGLSTVQNYIKAAGLAGERNQEPELPAIFAVPREPKIIKVVIGGVRYEDVTDIWIRG